MIITLNRNICRTCIALGEYLCGCDTTGLQAKDVSIVMRRAGPGVLQCEQYYADMGCGQWIGPKKRNVRVPQPGIRYCGFSLDAEGRVCFLWDSKLLEAEPGRYNGELFVCGKPVGVLKFQLGSKFAAGDVSCVTDEQCPSSPCPAPACH